MNSTSATKGIIVSKITTQKLSVSETQKMLGMLINIRNICCHDDKLFGFIQNKVNIMNTPIHQYFDLKNI